MATNDLNLKLTLSADGKQLSGTLKTAQGEVHAFGVKAEKAGDAATNSFSKTRKGVESISTQLQRAQSAALAFIGVSQGLSGISSIIKIADDYGEMAERIRMATTSTTDYELVQRRLNETAGGTYRQLAEAQELYIQTADALRNLQYTTSEQLDITDSLSYAFVVNATSVEKAAAATNAFSRSIQTSKVSAQDWQSLLMATPTLVNDIANATGKTTAEIRALGIQGRLGLEELTEGLRLARDENKRLSDAMATTVGDALTRLRGNFASYLGEINQSSGATYQLAGGIAAVAENIDNVLTVALVAGTTATARYTLSLAANTAASIKKSFAQRAELMLELQLAQAHEVTTKAALSQAHANTLLGGSHVAVTRAAAAHEASLRRLAAAQTTVQSGSRLLLGVIGGPTGLALTAAAVAASFINWGGAAKTAAEGTSVLNQTVEGLSVEQALYRLLQLEDEYTKTTEEIAKKEVRIRQLTQTLAVFPDHQKSDGVRNQIIELNSHLSTAQQRSAALIQLQKQLNTIISAPPKPRSGAAQLVVDEDAIKSITERLKQQYDQLRLNEAQYVELQLRSANASEQTIAEALAQLELTQSLKAQNQAKEQAAAITAQHAAATANVIEQLALEHAQLTTNTAQYLRLQLAATGATEAEIAVALSLLGLNESLKSQRDEQAKATAETAATQAALESWRDTIVAAVNPIAELEKEIEKLQKQWSAGLFDDQNLDENAFHDYIDSLKEKILELNNITIDDPAVALGNALQTSAAGVRDVAGALQGMYEQGSKGYQHMAIAQQAANVVSAVGAVLTQGTGDPYTAFARMTTMAAAVSSMGYQVSMLGGRFTKDTAHLSDGTGSVLGDASAQTESIVNAVTATADATSQLVGINRDMLRALMSLQAGVSRASLRITRAGTPAFNTIAPPTNIFDLSSSAANEVFKLPLAKQLDEITFGLMSGLVRSVGKLLGGKSSVTDSGIQILGGALAEMMQQTAAEAYQVTKSKKYAWSSSKTTTDYVELDDEISTQFSLVFGSIAESVRAGAEALGLSLTDIDEQIARFHVATQIISTKDLTGAEQQEELEAVFSKVFDDLAKSVVTFLPEFQLVGEGLGETLARVAINIQVAEEAASRLGFQAENIAANDFAALSIALIELSGGLDDFISSMSAFIDKFASDEHKRALVQDDLFRAFERVNLVVPTTREEMWALMQTLDANTAAGRAQIAALLELTDVADAYYDALERELKKSTQLLSQRYDLETQLLRLHGNELAAVARERQKELDALDPALRALMQQIYAQQDLNAVREKEAQQTAEITQLLSQRYDLETQLLRLQGNELAAVARERQKELDALDPALHALMQQIYAQQDLNETLTKYFTELSDYISTENAAIEREYNERIQLIEKQFALSKQLGDYVAKLRLSDLSPAGPAEKLVQAGDEFAALLVRAQAGDLEAAEKLQGAADTYLENADSYYGRSDIYTDIFDDVAKQLEELGLALSVASTEEHIKSLNEQMLAEQQLQRELLQSELDWAVAQYSKLTSIEHLLSVLPGNLGAMLQGQLNVEDLTPPSKPQRPINGSHSTGLARVPFDGYIAELHKGEAVLTAAENRALSQFDTAPLLSELKSIRNEVAQLRSENSQLRADYAQLAARAETQRAAQLRTAEQLERNSRTPVRVG